MKTTIAKLALCAGLTASVHSLRANVFEIGTDRHLTHVVIIETTADFGDDYGYSQEWEEILWPGDILDYADDGWTSYEIGAIWLEPLFEPEPEPMAPPAYDENRSALQILFEDARLTALPDDSRDWLTHRDTSFLHWPLDSSSDRTFFGTPNDARFVVGFMRRELGGDDPNNIHVLVAKPDTVQHEETEWRAVDPNENPGEWFVFSAGKVVILDRIKNSVKAIVGEKLASILLGALGDSFELQIRYTGGSLIEREFIGWSEIIFDWTTLSWVTVYHFKAYGPAKRILIDAHVEFRAYNVATGDSYVISSDRIPGAEDVNEFISRMKKNGAPPFVPWDIPDDFDFSPPTAPIPEPESPEAVTP